MCNVPDLTMLTRISTLKGLANRKVWSFNISTLHLVLHNRNAMLKRNLLLYWIRYVQCQMVGNFLLFWEMAYGLKPPIQQLFLETISSLPWEILGHFIIFGRDKKYLNFGAKICLNMYYHTPQQLTPGLVNQLSSSKNLSWFYRRSSNWYLLCVKPKWWKFSLKKM